MTLTAMTLPIALLGFLHAVAWPWLILATLVGALTLGYVSAPILAWTAFGGVLALGLFSWPWVLAYAVIMAVFNLPKVRRLLVSAPVMKTMKALMFLPVISETERTALTAGTVWIDGELFSGKPDWNRTLSEPYPDLTEEERAFIDGPCEVVCRMTDDWKVFQDRDLPENVWQYLKDEGFFGLIIPKEYGGKGFSASMNSAVVQKLSSRSGPLGITVMVPNSLGPAELLTHYGTPTQKDHYLPRLANGTDIPCFALTEPNAGSDAGGMSASGEVFERDGEFWVRLNWDKRYITLAAVSTVLGLAFRLRDPENHLGKGEDCGITCALIPSKTEGIVLGKRHDPLGVPFFNCPTEGHAVEVKLDEVIIGGRAGIGQGWRMLMECLAAGRGISLPASAAASAKMMARIGGAYSAVRKQFGLPIGKFEGIEEALARVGGKAYILEAARRTTCGGLDGGAKPAVVTAIAKYSFTELARECVTDTMDILGGKAISMGPRNPIAHAYMATPISITVEGANILTRTLIIFGQGAIRCHPYAWDEVMAVEKNDSGAFDKAFFGHIGHVVRNMSRSVVLSATRGMFATAPVTGPAAGYYRKLSWASASFATMADMAMAMLGGDLKRREALTGRFADVFSNLYLANAVLRRFEAEGRKKEDVPYMHYAMQHCLAEIQRGFDGIFRNFNVPIFGWFFRYPIGFWSRMNSMGTGPGDKTMQQVAQAMQKPGEQRDRMTAGMYIPTALDETVGQMEHALTLCTEADSIQKRIKEAVKKKQLQKKAPALLQADALRLGIITSADADLIARAEEARHAVVAVDSFTLDEYDKRGLEPTVPMGLRRLEDAPKKSEEVEQEPDAKSEAESKPDSDSDGDAA
ncbi:MAG: acyl-CoA dehydrogenase [Planctomycetota bacterium]|jgi:acyl-CoA dehydrogenase